MDEEHVCIQRGYKVGGTDENGLVFCKGKSIDSAYNGLFQEEGRGMLFGDSKGNTKGMC